MSALIPTYQDLANLLFFGKVFGSIAGLCFIAYGVIEHVIEPIRAIRLTKPRRPNVVVGRFGGAR